MPSLKEFHVDDELQGVDQRAIEVTLTLDDGTARWCYFMTPTALSAAGEWVPGTQVRFHYGAPHMIVVSEISVDIIERVLRYLDESGELLACSCETSGAG